MAGSAARQRGGLDAVGDCRGSRRTGHPKPVGARDARNARARRRDAALSVFRAVAAPLERGAFQLFAYRVHLLARLVDVGVEVAPMIREQSVGGTVQNN